MALGIAVGLALGVAGAAFGASDRWREGDHYEMGWTVLVAGKSICVGPFVRPNEREIECRTASAAP